jgi:hypothetical protein
VLWQIATGMAVANVTGSLLVRVGYLRGGSGFIRKIFIVVVSALILRTLWQAFARAAL